MLSATEATPLDVDLAPGRPPLLTLDGVTDAAKWADVGHDALRATVARHGAVLVRGLGLSDPTQVAEVFRIVGTGLMTEREAFAERGRYAEGVYSSSTWPPGQPMCLHHELSYASHIPGTMLFACLIAPSQGGTTPIADGTKVLRALPVELVGRFERQGWMLIRRYNEDIGASIADAFGTDDPARVEAYCRDNAIEAHWEPDGALVTRQRRPAVVRHPVTGEECWFNQVAFLSEWTLDPEVREFLVDSFGADALPFTTAFGDGEPIGPDIVDVINDTYTAHTVQEPWQPGDLLVIDNIRSAHGREPFTGDREIVVGMTDEVPALGDPSSQHSWS